MRWKSVLIAILIYLFGIILLGSYAIFNEINFVILPEKIMTKILISAIIAGLALSLVGTFVVQLKITTVGFAMSHSAFAGAALGLLLESYGSNFNPAYMAAIFTIIVALLLGPISDKTKLDSNIILGIMFSLMIALGFIFISIMPDGVTGSGTMGIIWGSIFGMNEEELIILIILNICIILFIVLFYKELMSIMLNQKMALAAGINVYFFKFLILFVTAIAVSFSINIVGAFLVYAMIVNPTSTVYQYVYDTKKLFIFSPIVGVMTILGGVFLSLWLDFPISSSIIVFSAAAFAFSVIISPKHQKVKKNDKKSKPNIKVNINKVKEFFDNHAKTWDENVYHDPIKLETIIKALELKKGENVLDVATGTGVMIPYLYNEVKMDGKIAAIDISDEMISITKEKYNNMYSNMELLVGDINELDTNKKFDAILCYSCFPHFLDQQLTIKKLVDLLKPKGKLMVAHSQSRKDINSIHKNVDGIVCNDRLPRMRILKMMMENASLDVKKIIDNNDMFYILGKKTKIHIKRLNKLSLYMNN